MSDTPDTKPAEAIKLTRTLGLRNNNIPTHIEMSEFSDGTICISLVTSRPELKPLITAMRVNPETFALLSEALSMAAHNPEIWKEVK